MRVGARRDGANHHGQFSQQSEIDRHTEALMRVAETALRDGFEAPACTFLLRSAKSVPVAAIAEAQEMLGNAGVPVAIILTKIDPEQEQHALFASLTALAPNNDLHACIRWARNPRLADVHEQAVYGSDLCWTGDAVRRDAESRNRLSMFDSSAEAIRRGTHAFKALWAASEPIPRHLLFGGAPDELGAIENCSKAAPIHSAAPAIDGWPILRH